MLVSSVPEPPGIRFNPKPIRSSDGFFIPQTMSPETSWILVNEVILRLQSATPRAVHCVGCEEYRIIITHIIAIREVTSAKKKNRQT